VPDLIAPQPPPVKNDLPASWDLVMNDFRERFESGTDGPVIATLMDMRGRDNFGAEKYGVRIQPENGRDNLADAYQELLDGAVYMRSELYELEERGDGASHEMRVMYDRVLQLVLDMRAAIWARDGK